MSPVPSVSDRPEQMAFARIRLIVLCVMKAASIIRSECTWEQGSCVRQTNPSWKSFILIHRYVCRLPIALEVAHSLVGIAQHHQGHME